MKRILVVGGGSIGERHVRCFLRTGEAEVSLCETRSEVRQRLADNYSLQHVFSAFDAALTEDFDGAVICTPAHLHILMATQLAKRGIGLLIEKPLSTSPHGVDQLAELVESQKLPVSIAYVMRQHPALQAMKQALDSGRFGRAVQIVYSGGQHFPFYRPAYRETYYTRHETGGGAIQDALTHIINAAEWLVGPVTKLVADAEHCVLEGVDVEDTVHVITRHRSVLGSFSLNQHQPANESTLTVLCERGAVRFEGHHASWSSCVEPDSAWMVEERFTLERDDLFVSQAKAFLSQLNGQSAACSLADGLQTLRVNLAALESVETESWKHL
ncbi:MAG: Gfo/Idh/MocA family oxidoreductase [Rhodopirellula sp.]|nr:Gfo/Idh/MocA family oxidoreductase [Rhodopirellula sp.]